MLAMHFMCKKQKIFSENQKGFRDGLSYFIPQKSEETRGNAITQPQQDGNAFEAYGICSAQSLGKYPMVFPEYTYTMLLCHFVPPFVLQNMHGQSLLNMPRN